MIQPISQNSTNRKNIVKYNTINFKKEISTNQNIPQKKWYEINARGNTIEKQRQNYSIALCIQTAIILGLLAMVATGTKGNIFSRFKPTKSDKFSSLNNDAKIPTVNECKSLNKNLKEILERQVNIANAPKDILAEFGNDIKSTNRFLLFGPPGTGKSFFARVFAKSTNAKYMEVLFSDMNSKWVGETEKNMKNIFDTVLKTGKKNPENKYVLTFNEIDSLVTPPENLSQSTGTHWVSILRQRSIFLNYLEILKEQAPNITIIGTTNITPKNSNLDRAAMSRFQNLIEVDYPDKECLYQALKRSLQQIKFSKDILNHQDSELRILSEKMAKRKFSFRNLENAIQDAKENYINERLKGNKTNFDIKFLQKSEQSIKLSDGELEKI